MKWVEIKIHTSREAIEPISNILHEADVGGLVIEDKLDVTKGRTSIFGEIFDINMDRYPIHGVFLKAYLLANDEVEKRIKTIEQSIYKLQSFGINIGRNQITINEVKEEDWSTSWKKYYKPVQISDRISITPTWEAFEQKENEIVIELDPGMAFGTGTHPTTILSILALEKYLNNGDTVIDVGSGSGVLSIAAVRLGAKFVNAFDLDEVAVKSTTLNCKLNHVSEVVEVKQNNLLADIFMQVDVIVSNILAEIIIHFVQDAWNNLIDGGLFIMSGIIREKQHDVKEELTRVGFQIIDKTESENWICIVAKKA